MEDIQDTLVEIAKIEHEHELKNKPETRIICVAFVKYYDGTKQTYFAESLKELGNLMHVPYQVIKFSYNFKQKYLVISNYEEKGFEFLCIEKYEVQKGKVDEFTNNVRDYDF